MEIYLNTHSLLSGRLSTSFEPALSSDPLIQTLLGKKMPSSGCSDKFGTEVSGQKPNFRDQAFPTIAWGPDVTKNVMSQHNQIALMKIGCAKKYANHHKACRCVMPLLQP